MTVTGMRMESLRRPTGPEPISAPTESAQRRGVGIDTNSVALQQRRGALRRDRITRERR
jgi:hypothetical protein